MNRFLTDSVPDPAPSTPVSGRTPDSGAVLRVHLSALLKNVGGWALLAVVLATFIYLLTVKLAEAPYILRAATPASLRPQPPYEILELLRFTGGTPLLIEFLPLLGIAAAAWALLVWKEERWGERDYLWSLPVDRPDHELLRVAAGAVWLCGAIALFSLIGIGLAVLSGQTLLPEGSWPAWLSVLLMPLTIYLIVSIPTVATRSPLSWIVAGILGVVLVRLIIDLAGIRPPAELWLPGAPFYGWSMGSVSWFAPMPEFSRDFSPTAWLASLVSLCALTLLGLRAAASRTR